MPIANKLLSALFIAVMLIMMITKQGHAQIFRQNANPYTNLLIGPPLLNRDVCHAAASECLSGCSATTPVRYWANCRQFCSSRLNTCRQGQQSLWERQQRRLDTLAENGVIILQRDLNRYEGDTRRRTPERNKKAHNGRRRD